jgi:hypothetical protein
MTAVFPPIDAIQEFSEETQDADARYGRGNGGTINAVIKSGTDQVSRRRLRVSAQHRSGRQKRFQYSKAGPTGQKAPLRQNEFGATFGGPVFWKQANPKTFFFADYAGKRFAQGQTNVESVPVVNITSAGYDFSAYSAQPVSRTHSTMLPIPRISFQQSHDPLIDPDRREHSEFLSEICTAELWECECGTANNFFYGPLLIINEDDFDVKIDRKFTEKDSAFLRYSQGHDIFSQPGILPTPLVGDVICGPASDPAHQAVLSETHIFSPPSSTRRATAGLASLSTPRTGTRACNLPPPPTSTFPV